MGKLRVHCTGPILQFSKSPWWLKGAQPRFLMEFEQLWALDSACYAQTPTVGLYRDSTPQKLCLSSFHDSFSPFFLVGGRLKGRKEPKPTDHCYMLAEAPCATRWRDKELPPPRWPAIFALPTANHPSSEHDSHKSLLNRDTLRHFWAEPTTKGATTWLFFSLISPVKDAHEGGNFYAPRWTQHPSPNKHIGKGHREPLLTMPNDTFFLVSETGGYFST